MSQEEDTAVGDTAIPQAKKENVIGNGNQKKKVMVECMGEERALLYLKVT